MLTSVQVRRFQVPGGGRTPHGVDLMFANCQVWAFNNVAQLAASRKEIIKMVLGCVKYSARLLWDLVF